MASGKSLELIKHRWAVRTVLIVLLLAGVLHSAKSLSSEQHSFRLGSSGTIDFVQYWSAFQLMESNENPYDGIKMHRMQETVGQGETQTTMMWNPPWTVLLLSPVLNNKFETSARIWFLLNLFFLALATIAVGKLVNSRHQIILGLAGVGFVPVLVTIQLGQISLLITCGIILGAYALARGRDILGGILLAICTVKPHLFFLFAVPIIIWLLNTKRWMVLVGAGFCTAILVFATLLRWPDSISWWLLSMQEPTQGPGAIPRWLWRTGTLTTQLRMFLGQFTGTYPIWPMWAVPTSALIASVIYYSGKKKVDWFKETIPLLCLSLALGAYGWLFDYSILLPCQLILVAYYLEQESEPKRKRLLFYSLALVQVFAVALCFRDKPDYIDFFWMPLALLFIWLKFLPRLEPLNN